MKKLISILLCITVFALSFTGIVFAGSEAEKNQEIVINEFDYIETLSKLTDEELIKEGLSRGDVDLLFTEYITSIKDRAGFSTEKLLSLGYTQEQCAILHQFDSTGEISRDQLYAVAAIVTGNVTCNSVYNNVFTISFTWQWSTQPSICFSDICAIRWAAFNYNGEPMDSDLLSKNLDVYYSHNGNYYALGHGILNESSDFSYVSYTFPLTMYVDGSYDEATNTSEFAFAKMGRMTLSITSNNVNNNPIGHIKLRAAYGHKTIVISNPSVTITPGSEGVGFTFSGLAYRSDEMFGKMYRINLNETVTEI